MEPGGGLVVLRGFPLFEVTFWNHRDRTNPTCRTTVQLHRKRREESPAGQGSAPRLVSFSRGGVAVPPVGV